jgi:hypothetical protein
MPTQPFSAGGYRFMPHAFQYSGGAIAEPGFAVERARFRRPLPLAQGFDAVEAYLAKLGRPPTAFCACELRSPTQFSEQGFIDFNRHYVQRLERWGIFKDDINPVRAQTSFHRSTRPPSRRFTPSATRFQATPAALSSREAAKRARAAPATASASSVMARPHPRRCGRRRGSCSK